MAVSFTKNTAQRLGNCCLWTLCVVFCWATSSVVALLHIPSPYLFVSAAIGLALALGGHVRRQFPARINLAAQAAIGSLVGFYIDFAGIRLTGTDAFVLAAAILTTVALCLLTGWLLPRIAPVATVDAVLGMVPGSPSAMVMIADGLQADSRAVAVIQYLRVAMIAASIPLVLIVVGTNSSNSRDAGLPDAVRLIGSENQLLGVVGLIAVCVAGHLAGRLMRLPAPAILGPLLLSAAVPQTINQQILPSELAKQFMFVVIGLEIGLRFQRAQLQQAMHLLRGVTCAALALGIVSAVVASGLAALIDISFLNAYLAVAPGGLNPILAAGVSANANILFIASMQTLRLVAMVVLTTPTAHWLRKRTAHGSGRNTLSARYRTVKVADS